MPTPTLQKAPRFTPHTNLFDWINRLLAFLDSFSTLGLPFSNVTVDTGFLGTINIGLTSCLRIATAAGNFAIQGIAGGYPGRMICIINATAFTMTLTNEDGAAADENQINTTTGANLVGPTNVLLVHSDVRWQVVSFQP